MRSDIAAAKRLRADGVVLGILEPEGMWISIKPANWSNWRGPSM